MLFRFIWRICKITWIISLPWLLSLLKLFFTPIVYFEDGSEQNTSHHFALIIIFSETKNQKLLWCNLQLTNISPSCRKGTIPINSLVTMSVSLVFRLTPLLYIPIWPFTLLNITMNILHTVLYTFPKVLARRICLTIKSFFFSWSFPLFLWP